MNAGALSPLSPLLAVAFGLLSFVSPCCLPLLPAYLGLIAGSARATDAPERRGRLCWNGLSIGG
jgi:cytochrome c-type biogenesis protein